MKKIPLYAKILANVGNMPHIVFKYIQFYNNYNSNSSNTSAFISVELLVTFVLHYTQAIYDSKVDIIS